MESIVDENLARQMPSIIVKRMTDYTVKEKDDIEQMKKDEEGGDSDLPEEIKIEINMSNVEEEVK